MFFVWIGFVQSILANVEIMRCSYRVLSDWPHVESRFTQGLYWQEGWLFESTGGYGASRLIKQKFPQGNVTNMHALWPSEFAEDITVIGQKVYQLSWKSRTVFVYDKYTLNPIRRYRYRGQGWGLTHTDQYFIRSNGSHCVFYHDLVTFTQLGKRCLSNTSYRLNALSYYDGILYANNFPGDQLLRIHLQTMMVLDYIDLGRLRSGQKAGVANGVAVYMPGEIMVTGKNWDKFYVLDIKSCRSR